MIWLFPLGLICQQVNQGCQDQPGYFSLWIVLCSRSKLVLTTRPEGTSCSTNQSKGQEPVPPRPGTQLAQQQRQRPTVSVRRQVNRVLQGLEGSTANSLSPTPTEAQGGTAGDLPYWSRAVKRPDRLWRHPLHGRQEAAPETGQGGSRSRCLLSPAWSA